MNRSFPFPATLASLLTLSLVAASSVLAEEQRAPFASMRTASLLRLEQVRAGSAFAPSIPPPTTGVILWDEVRLPPPPLRNSGEHSRVTVEANTFHR